MATVVSTERLQRLSTFFRRAVDAGRLPGFAVSVNNGAQTVFADHHGLQDVAASSPIDTGTIFRIFSMTKPITSVATMMLYERGDLDLRAPVRDFIPEFADTPVCLDGAADPTRVGPQTTELTVWHLLTHTAGLTYRFMGDNRINGLYDTAQIAEPYGPATLAQSCRALAGIPLLFQPGSAWNYSVATDVLGRVVEVAAGTDLDKYLQVTVFDPLGMSETGFSVPPAERHRVATLYWDDADGSPLAAHELPAGDPPTLLSGGGGLYSTMADYQKFVLMLAAGGRAGTDQLISPETLRYMTRNHLPRGVDLAGYRRYPMEDDLAGLGFGLGFAVVTDAPARRILTRDGVFYWNGAAGTTFLIDPTSGLSATFMMQVRSPTNFRWEARLHQLLYQALI